MSQRGQERVSQEDEIDESSLTLPSGERKGLTYLQCINYSNKQRSRLDHNSRARNCSDHNNGHYSIPEMAYYVHETTKIRRFTYLVMPYNERGRRGLTTNERKPLFFKTFWRENEAGGEARVMKKEKFNGDESVGFKGLTLKS